MDKELLSAILDGESSAEELDRWMATGGREPRVAAEQAATMRRYGVIAQAIRQESGIADAGFSARVMAACGAPPTTAQVPAEPVGNPFARRRATARRERLRSNRWLPAAGMAMAASLAVIAVLAVRPVADAPTAAPAEVAEVLRSPPQAVPIVAVADGTERAAVRTLSPRSRQRISSYVMDYSNSRATNGFSTPLGYARLAAHTGTPGSSESR